MERNRIKSFIPTQKQKQALKVLQLSDSNTAPSMIDTKRLRSEVPLAALMGKGFKKHSGRLKALQKEANSKEISKPTSKPKRRGKFQKGILTKHPSKVPSLLFCKPTTGRSKVPMRQLFKAASCNHKCGYSSNIIFLEKIKWVGREANPRRL